MPLARNVCITCRSRKKACDKQLPQCGFCKRRGFLCQYRYNDTSSPSSPITVRGPQPDDAAACTSPFSYNAASIRDLASVHSAVDDAVRQVLNTLGAGFDEAAKHYFDVFHPRLSVVSPSIALEASTPHRADTAVLLLAMYVASKHPLSDGSYASLRMLFTQAQISVCTSLPLVQTQLLVAVYEYSKGWTDMATLSLAQCVRMASILGIHQPRIKDLSQSDEQSVWESLLGYAVWWGIIILDRAISAECLEESTSPVTAFLDQDFQLLTDLEHQYSIHLGHSGDLGASEGSAKAFGDLGRLPEASHLLHRVLRLRRYVRQSSSRSDELEVLDSELQTFLKCLLDEESHFHKPCANEIAITVRAMFVLHQTNLALPINASTDESRQKSWAVLNTATNLVVEAAQHHTKEDTMSHAHLALPLCCASNLRDAKQYISTVHFYRDTGSPATASKTLEGLEYIFNQRWRVVIGKDPQ